MPTRTPLHGIKPLSLLFIVFLQLGQVSAQTVDQQVDDYIKKEMSKYQIPGLSVAVARNGRILKLKGYGVASIEFDVPANKNSVYPIYSTTKIFAGVAIMKLVEAGKLSLDTSITDIIENLPDEWKAIRIRNLLTHTSGLSELRENPRFLNLPEEKKKYLPREEGMRFVAELPLKSKPGDKFVYHTSGYNILGVIVERVAKKSFAAVLEESVFAPLKMVSTRMGDTETIIRGRLSTPYIRQAGELRNTVVTYGVNGGNPGAGLNSSVADLAKFLIALDTGKILKPESLQALWTPVKLNDGTVKGYGLGWTIDEKEGRKVVGHEGGGAAWVAHYPNEHLSVVVLCNLNGARADEIQYGIANIILGK